MDSTQAGAQTAANSQTTIDLQAGIITSHQDEIGRANVRITDQAAEIDRLKIVVADRNAKVAELMGAAARAEMAADELALLKRQIDNLKRHIAEYCPAAPAAPSEQVEPTNWLPTADNINALPEGIRSYVHQLAARCDPAGDVAQNVFLSDQCAGLQVMYRKASDALAEVRGCFEAAEVEGLAQVLADTHDDRLKDLVQRRLNYAYEAACSIAAAPAAPLPAQPDPSERTCYEDNDGATRCISCHANHDQNQDHGEDCWVDRAQKVAALAGAAPLPELTGPSLTADEKLQRNIMLGMADCMDMVRTDLIEMGIIDKTVAPMFIPEAVANYCQRLAASPSPAPAPTEPQDDQLPTLQISGAVCEIGELEGEGGQHGILVRRAPDSFVTIKGLAMAEVKALSQHFMDDISIHFGSATSPASRMGGITSKASSETATPGASIGDDPEFDKLAEAWCDLLIKASSPTSFNMYDKKLAEARAALVAFLDQRAGASTEDKQ